MPENRAGPDKPESPDRSDTPVVVTTSGTLTVSQVAADLQIPESTVRQLARDGTLPMFRAGGRHWRINVDDFEAWKHDRARRRARLLTVL
jgi:excisionase family DNA binding protein